VETCGGGRGTCEAHPHSNKTSSVIHFIAALHPAG